MHRDSLGTALSIKPGELNLMTAGRGIVHSERTGAGAARQGAAVVRHPELGLALPKSHEEGAPAFAHHDAGELPRIDGDGKTRARHHGLGSTARPLRAAFPHPAFYAEAVLAPGAVLPLDPDYDERAVFMSRQARSTLRARRSTAGRLLVFRPGDRISILAVSQARLMLLGGEPMDGPRHIWWNFVSSSKDRIDAGQGRLEGQTVRWRAGRRTEFIPLPE